MADSEVFVGRQQSARKIHFFSLLWGKGGGVQGSSPRHSTGKIYVPPFISQVFTGQLIQILFTAWVKLVLGENLRENAYSDTVV